MIEARSCEIFRQIQGSTKKKVALALETQDS